MAFQALGWLSKTTGWDISGRANDSAAGEQPPQQNYFGSQQQGSGDAVEGYLSAMSNTVFGGEQPVQQQQQQQQGAGSTSAGGNSDGVQYDAEGLPIARDWYFYDNEKQMWGVSDDAPAHIKQEHAAKIKELEDEKLGIKKVAPPPPPPKFGAPSMGGGSPTTLPPPPTKRIGGKSPLYAQPQYFKHD